MEGRKESKYNLTGTCPKCGDLIKVEHIISVDLVDLGTTTKTEEVDHGNAKFIAKTLAKGAESSGVRPADKKGPTTATSGDPKPADSKKSKRAKKTGGNEQ